MIPCLFVCLSVCLTTANDADTTAPQISNIQVESVDHSTALITWQTDEVCDTHISVDQVDGNDHNETGSLEYTTSHSILVTRLTASADYQFTVDARDIDGNETTSSVMLFSTSANDIYLSRISFAEGNFANYCIATFSATFSNSVYMLVEGTGDADNALFAINDGKLYFTEVADYETRSSYSIRVTGANSSDESVDKQFVINVIDMDEDDFDQDGIANYLDNDDDNDGITDDFETAHGLNQFDASDGDLDDDNDGFSNYVEFLNGIDPTISNSDSGDTENFMETVTIYPGWNLIPLNANPQKKVLDHFEGIDVSESCWVWNNSISAYRQIGRSETADANMALWVESTTSINIPLANSAEVPSQLISGWNLLVIPAAADQYIDEIAVMSEAASIWGWDNETQSYFQVEPHTLRDKSRALWIMK